MTSLCQHLSAQEIVNWSRLLTGVFTPLTQRNLKVSSRRRRRCVLGIRFFGPLTPHPTSNKTNTGMHS